MSNNPNILERVHDHFKTVVAIGTLAALAAVGVGAYDLYNKVNQLEKALPHIGVPGQSIPAHGHAALNLKTEVETPLYVECPVQVTVDAGVYSSASYKLFGVTIAGATFNKLEPVEFAECGQGIKSVATTLENNGIPERATISLANYHPTDVGINDLNPLACMPLTSSATPLDIAKAEAHYDKAVKANKIPSCDDGLGTQRLGATTSQASSTEEFGRRLVDITGAIAPLPEPELKRMTHDAEIQIARQYHDMFPNVPLKFIPPNYESPIQQIARGYSSVSSELKKDFGKDSEQFVMDKNRLQLQASEKGGVHGDIYLHQTASPEQLAYLNSLTK